MILMLFPLIRLLTSTKTYASCIAEGDTIQPEKNRLWGKIIITVATVIGTFISIYQTNSGENLINYKFSYGMACCSWNCSYGDLSAVHKGYGQHQGIFPSAFHYWHIWNFEVSGNCGIAYYCRIICRFCGKLFLPKGLPILDDLLPDPHCRPMAYCFAICFTWVAVLLYLWVYNKLFG